ncbi:MAG TPA: FtsQ-type POTRA domain-containing protein [Gaiellaceae bacterium]|nr:FtsQ-type POTRA domain-containing protein [Gaiellaceae bacterium]
MVTRPHLALPSAQALRPAFGRPPARVVTVVAAVAAALGLLYVAARETSLFAVRTIAVTGASPQVRAAVVDAASTWEGESLVALDGEALRRRLESLSFVRSVEYDRAFPHTLALEVVPERRAAVVRGGRDAWIVSERGRVMEAVEAEASGRLPRVRPAEGDLRPGDLLEQADTRLAVAAATRIPRAFPVRVRSIRARDGDITLRLAGGMELRVGRADDLGLKLAVAARVLRSLRAEEARALAYLDVTVPERPVASGTLDSQVEG